jgi:hypothetical protein
MAMFPPSRNRVVYPFNGQCQIFFKFVNCLDTIHRDVCEVFKLGVTLKLDKYDVNNMIDAKNLQYEVRNLMSRLPNTCQTHP